MSFCKCMVLFILIKSKIYSFKINTFSWWRDVLNQFNRVAASDIVSDEFSKASSIMPAWWESWTSPSCEILHWNLKASWAITFECGQSLQLKRQNTWSGWKSYLLKVSLSVVVIFFPRMSHFCVHETCPAFAWVYKRSWGWQRRASTACGKWRQTQPWCKNSTNCLQEILSCLHVNTVCTTNSFKS